MSTVSQFGHSEKNIDKRKKDEIWGQLQSQLNCLSFEHKKMELT